MSVQKANFCANVQTKMTKRANMAQTKPHENMSVATQRPTKTEVDIQFAGDPIQTASYDWTGSRNKATRLKLPFTPKLFSACNVPQNPGGHANLSNYHRGSQQLGNPVRLEIRTVSTGLDFKRTNSHTAELHHFSHRIQWSRTHNDN